jgi:hypothetical protein
MLQLVFVIPEEKSFFILGLFFLYMLWKGWPQTFDSPPHFLLVTQGGFPLGVQYVTPPPELHFLHTDQKSLGGGDLTPHKGFGNY